MGKTTRFQQLIHNWMFIFLMGIVMSAGNFFPVIAVEKPEAKQPEPAKVQDDKKKQTDDKVIPDENVKMFLNQIEIYGTIAKPQTVFIIPGTDPRVDGLRIDRHFFSHIFRPVEKSTLRRVQIKQGNDKDHILW
jgi:hypothetical protein